MTPTPRRIGVLYTQACRALLSAIALIVLALVIPGTALPAVLALAGLVVAGVAADRGIRAYLLWRER